MEIRIEQSLVDPSAYTILQPMTHQTQLHQPVRPLEKQSRRLPIRSMLLQNLIHPQALARIPSQHGSVVRIHDPEEPVFRLSGRHGEDEEGEHRILVRGETGEVEDGSIGRSENGLTLKAVERDVRGAGAGNKVEHACFEEEGGVLVARCVPEEWDGCDPVESLSEAACDVKSD
jgi:hypothetical protein